MDRYTELLTLAQRSAEERLSLATDMLFNEDDDNHPAYSVLAGPYCGCDTCVVREVLDAAWAFMRELALMEETDEPG